MEDQKEGEGGAAAASDPDETRLPTGGNEDRKPTHDQLMMRTDSECLSSIINTTPSNNNGFARDEMGPMQFDFSSYGHPSAPSIGGGGGGVSLTLGLQQHGGGGVTLAFTPPPPPQFYGGRDGGGDGMEDCNAVEYSMFDGENQNLQYRNLTGAQLLRDLGG